jgi:glycosyltransferase involved in cell wall biosynthesis
MPDLVAIMAVYEKDKLKFVKESILSILGQTFSDFHYFIVFNGAVSDDVKAYINSIKDSRIRLFELKQNVGLAKALNYLLDILLNNTEYRFIARMDADDISTNKRFEIQRNFLLENMEISCVGSWYKEIDEAGNFLSYQKLPVTNEEIKIFLRKRSPFAHPSVMFRKEMIEKAGNYPTDTMQLEDYVLWSNALKSGLILANIPEYLLLFRRDKEFYKRRSGFRFGFNYIKTRFRINRILEVPSYIYLYSFLVGLIRMMPAFLIRFIYQFHRKKNSKNLPFIL